MTVIKERRSVGETVPEKVLELLPPKLRHEIYKLCQRGCPVEEIRLRAGRTASVTSCGRNVMLEAVLTQAELQEIFENVCEGSLYAYADTIRQGYVTVSGGIRVGIAGRAAVTRGEIVGVYDVCGLCFRLPHPVLGVGGAVCRLLREMERGRGVLVYSPPGEGKTTLIRSVAREMAGGEQPWRVVAVDTRGELGYGEQSPYLCLDIMTGYPKAVGIEIAARCMNAQLIVCDEIGGVEEAEAIIAVQNCGVPLLATAHGESIDGLLRRTGMGLLHRAGVFGAYAGIRRRRPSGDYEYKIDLLEEFEGA